MLNFFWRDWGKERQSRLYSGRASSRAHPDVNWKRHLSLYAWEHKKFCLLRKLRNQNIYVLYDYRQKEIQLRINILTYFVKTEGKVN
jgi:hypothetical protein